MTTEIKKFTDYGAEADPDDCIECRYCGSHFDPSHEGYIDENTGIAFCDAPCEMHFHHEDGLPEEYQFA